MEKDRRRGRERERGHNKRVGRKKERKKKKKSSQSRSGLAPFGAWRPQLAAWRRPLIITFHSQVHTKIVIDSRSLGLI